MHKNFALLTCLFLLAACQNPAEPVRDNYNDVGYYQGTQLAKPADDATINAASQTITFTWDQEPMESTFSYTFQIKPADVNSWPNKRVGVGNKHDFAYPTDTLKAGTNYEWRAGRNWYKDGENVVYWSKSRTFLFE